MKETVITKNDLKALLEYSSTFPTGKTIGKRWRRACGQEWKIGEYCDMGSDTHVGIQWTWAVEAPGKPHRGKL